MAALLILEGAMAGKFRKFGRKCKNAKLKRPFIIVKL